MDTQESNMQKIVDGLSALIDNPHLLPSEWKISDVDQLRRKVSIYLQHYRHIRSLKSHSLCEMGNNLIISSRE